MKIVIGIANERDTEACTSFLKSSRNATEITAVAVIPQAPGFSSVMRDPRRLLNRQLNKLQELEQTYATELLDSFGEGVQQLGMKYESSVIVGNPADEMIAVAGNKKADFLLITRGHGERGKSSRPGGTATRVARYAPCSVILLNPDIPAPKALLLATDGSSGSETAGKAVRQLGIKGNPTLVICSVVPEFSPIYLRTGGSAYTDYRRAASEIQEKEKDMAQQILLKSSATFRNGSFKTRTRLYTGDIVEALEQAIRENVVDLLIMGARGTSSVDRFHLGGTTVKLLNRVTCSMLIAR